MTALVTCADHRQSLAAVRALGRATIPVAVGAHKRPSLAMWSRYASSTFLTEDASHDAEAFAKHIALEIKGRCAQLLLASSDDAWWALSRYREYIPMSACRILPPHISVVRALDPEALQQFADSLGIACVQMVQRSAGAQLDLRLQFPLLLMSRKAGARSQRMIVDTKAQLQKQLHETQNLLACSYVGKRRLAIFGIADRGEILVEGYQQLHERLELNDEIAPVAVTIEPIASLRNTAQILLAAMQWQGPFKLDFIEDEHHVSRLLSLTGRLWDSLELAIKARMNIPLMCYHMATGTIPKNILHNATPHINLRWIVGDVIDKMNHPVRSITDLRQYKLLASMLRRQKLKHYLDVFDKDDIMPFLFELQMHTWKKALNVVT